MMKTQHTPGPWEYIGSSIVGPNIGSSEEKWLRPVIARFSTGVSLANLNLMLSVPELLDSLKVMLRDYAAVHGVGDLEMQPALLQASAAIAKATGGEA